MLYLLLIYLIYCISPSTDINSIKVEITVLFYLLLNADSLDS